VSNLLYYARSRCPPEAEYSRKSVAANDGLQWTNRALIPHVVVVTPHVVDEEQRSLGGNKRWHPTVWWRRREVGTSREKIRSEGGGFRSGATDCGGQDTRECKRERERHKMELPLSELEQPTLDDHTSWYLCPQARARAIPAYYKYGPSTNGQCEHGH
jgi:hypothetical protein